MLGATGLWIVVMTLMFFGSMGASALDDDKYIDIGNGEMVDRRTGDTVHKGAHAVGSFGGSLCVGICFPTIPYTIAMVALGVTYFAMKPER